MEHSYVQLINNPREGITVESVLMRRGKKNKTLIAIPQNGLGDRIKLLASSLYLCAHEDINLVVMWAKNCSGYSSCCGIFDIFQSTEIKSIDNPRMTENEYISTDPVNDLKVLDRVWVSGNTFFKSTFSNQEAMSFLYPFILNIVSPKVVASLTKYKTKDCVGVHVRRGDLCEVNEQQYRIVPEEDFFAKIDKDQKVFLCTEDEKVRASFLKNYGKNLTFVENGKLDRSSVEGAITALTEILLLSRCKKIFCSPSGFSEVAAMFSSAEREVVYPSSIQCFFPHPDNEHTIQAGLVGRCLYCGKSGKRDGIQRVCSATYEEAQQNQFNLRHSIVGDTGLLWGVES